MIPFLQARRSESSAAKPIVEQELISELKAPIPKEKNKIRIDLRARHYDPREKRRSKSGHYKSKRTQDAGSKAGRHGMPRPCKIGDNPRAEPGMAVPQNPENLKRRQDAGATKRGPERTRHLAKMGRSIAAPLQTQE
jgi:hypothetical protein